MSNPSSCSQISIQLSLSSKTITVAQAIISWQGFLLGILEFHLTGPYTQLVGNYCHQFPLLLDKIHLEADISEFG